MYYLCMYSILSHLFPFNYRCVILSLNLRIDYVITSWWKTTALQTNGGRKSRLEGLKWLIPPQEGIYAGAGVCVRGLHADPRGHYIHWVMIACGRLFCKSFSLLLLSSFSRFFFLSLSHCDCLSVTEASRNNQPEIVWMIPLIWFDPLLVFRARRGPGTFDHRPSVETLSGIALRPCQVTTRWGASVRSSRSPGAEGSSSGSMSINMSNQNRVINPSSGLCQWVGSSKVTEAFRRQRTFRNITYENIPWCFSVSWGFSLAMWLVSDKASTFLILIVQKSDCLIWCLCDFRLRGGTGDEAVLVHWMVKYQNGKSME